MKRRIARTRALEWVLLALLAICFGQVVWWVLEEARNTRQAASTAVERQERDAAVANRLLAEGVRHELLRELYPELVASERGFAISEELLETIADERWHRLNRYGWEGSFFLLVLGAGMSLVGRLVRRERELRRRHHGFLAAVSHEFKTPVASLRLSAETLALRDPPSDRRQQLVTRILDDLTRLETMISNLLEVARIEEARPHMARERLELRSLVEGALQRFKEQAEKAEVELVSVFDAPFAVTADPAAAQAIVDNLLDNALKACAGRDEARVTLAASRDGERVRLDVRDTGRGFQPVEAERLFAKFYSVAPTGRRSGTGTGLGLYLVKRLAQLGGGRAAAWSDGPDTGATFSVWWPAARELEEAA